MNIRKLLISLLLLSCYMPWGYADSSQTPPLADLSRKEMVDLLSQDFSSNINRLNQHLTNLKVSSVQTQAHTDYESLFNTNPYNMEKIRSISNDDAQQDTQKQVLHFLTEVPNHLKSTHKSTNLITKLTTQTIASDSLPSTPSTLSYFSNASQHPKPLENDAFNFDALFAPTIYNDHQKNAVEKYKQFLLFLYASGTDGVEWNNLKQMIHSSPDAKERLEKMPEYQRYQIARRSKIAEESLLLSNINMLVSERTPVMQHGKMVSLLELMRQKANRADDPHWLNQTKTASTADIEREQLRVLADIRQSLYDDRITNERILTTMTLLTSLALQLSHTSFETLTKDLNDRIANTIHAQDATQRQKITEQIDGHS